MAIEFSCYRCLQTLRQAQSYSPLDRVFSRSRAYNAPQQWTVKGFKSAPKQHSSRCRSVHDSKVKAPGPVIKIASVRQPRGLQTVSAPVSLPPENRVLLKPNNLFHAFSKSPSSTIRSRAAFIEQNAFCPHPSHQQTRLPTSPHDPEVRKTTSASSVPPAHSRFECPDCGVPIYCTEEHWMDDYEAHLEVCDTLRQINADDHDLVSGRFFPEFSYPGPQDDNFVINLTNWDTFLYTRQFEAINNERSMRQVTRMLTYPITIASFLHELSPYNIRKGERLTVEGLKSLSG